MKKNTPQDLLDAGREEFLEKGFRDASMRGIAARAGLTTGAIYAHYPDKEALFRALVEPAADTFLSRFVEAQENFRKMPDEEQIGLMYTYSDQALYELLDYVYDNFSSFRLIFCCSAGTEYANYLHRLIDIEAEGTRQFIAMLKRNGRKVMDMTDNMIHILNSAYFSSIFETVAHDMPREEAFAYIRGMVTFFNAGWGAVLGFN